MGHLTSSCERFCRVLFISCLPSFSFVLFSLASYKEVTCEALAAARDFILQVLTDATVSRKTPTTTQHFSSRPVAGHQLIRQSFCLSVFLSLSLSPDVIHSTCVWAATLLRSRHLVKRHHRTH